MFVVKPSKLEAVGAWINTDSQSGRLKKELFNTNGVYMLSISELYRSEVLVRPFVLLWPPSSCLNKTLFK